MMYDISPLITEDIKVWPGDTPPTREVLADFEKGDNLTLSTLHATVHLGAHADAPSHFGRGARSIDRQSLDIYIGPCQVVPIDVPRATRISPSDVTATIHAPRVLLATGTYLDPAVFNDDFVALSPELVEMLAGSGVKLIGIDTPSVDLFDSKNMPAHKACLAHDVAILEGLALEGVPEGVYELIALPLKLAGFDASPVRAVLRTLM